MNARTPHIPRLETERLILRAPSEADLDTEAEFFASETSRFVGGPLRRDETWRTIATLLGHRALRGYGFWGVEEKETGTYVDHVGLWCPEGWPEPEIGWTRMDEAEGKGLAFEAAIAARDFAARNQGLNGVISYIAHSNDRSRALAERLGATYEREGEVVGEPCQVWRHPEIAIPEPALTSERTGQ